MSVWLWYFASAAWHTGRIGGDGIQDTLSPFGMSWHLEYMHRNSHMSKGRGSTETLHPVQTSAWFS